MRWLAVCLVLIACGQPRRAQDVPASATTAAAAFPLGPPLLTPGERMTYRLTLKGFDLASYTFSVGDIEQVGGRNAVVVQGHAKSVGLAHMVAKIDDRFTSWIDIATGRSLRFQTDEHQAKTETGVEHAVADLTARVGDTVPVTFQLNDQPATPERQKVSLPDVWDYNSFIVALRSWEGPAGSTIASEVLRSRWMWRVTMTIRGKQKLVTELGALPTLRLDGHTYKLDRNGARFPNTDARDFSVWISDDDGRVPLLITARTDYGDIKMEIVDYQPGTGQRLRP